MDKPTLLRPPRRAALQPTTAVEQAPPLVALPPLSAPLERPRLGASAATAARAIWQTRRLLFGLLAAAALGSVGAAQVPGAFAGPVGEALLGAMFIAFGLLRGIDGNSRHSAFWLGLGCSPMGWELGAVGLDLAAMATAGALSWALGGGYDVGTAGLLMGLLLYGFASATRASAPAEAGRASRMLPVILGAVGASAVAISTGLGTVFESIGLSFGLCALSGLLLRLFMANRWPEAAAGRGLPRPLWALSAVAGLLASPIMWARQPGDLRAHAAVQQLGELYEPDSADGPMWDKLYGSRALWWAEPGEAPQRLPMRGFFVRVDEHPSGVVSWRRVPALPVLQLRLRPAQAGKTRMAAVALAEQHGVDGVRLADGQIVECPVQVWGRFKRPDWVSDDGLRAESLDDRGKRWQVDATGCHALPEGAR